MLDCGGVPLPLMEPCFHSVMGREHCLVLWPGGQWVHTQETPRVFSDHLAHIQDAQVSLQSSAIDDLGTGFASWVYRMLVSSQLWP